jgi:transposase
MAGFVPVELAASSPSAKAREAGRIEVRGRRGLMVSLDGEVDRAALKQVLDVRQQH